jgi:hypothetical protein
MMQIVIHLAFSRQWRNKQRWKKRRKSSKLPIELPSVTTSAAPPPVIAEYTPGLKILLF